MVPRLTLKPIEIDTGSDDHEARMVMADGRLVAVLVRLSAVHEFAAGRWFLEVGFGRLRCPAPSPFPTLDAAQDWILQELLRFSR